MLVIASHGIRRFIRYFLGERPGLTGDFRPAQSRRRVPEAIGANWQNCRDAGNRPRALNASRLIAALKFGTGA